MLKVTYTETGLHLERLSRSLESWLAVRVVLMVRIGQPLFIEHCYASLLLPATLEQLDELEAVIEQEEGAVTLSICDVGWVEVSMPGVWVSSHANGSPSNQTEGVFVTWLSHHTEQLLAQLWKVSQAQAWSLSRE